MVLDRKHIDSKLYNFRNQIQKNNFGTKYATTYVHMTKLQSTLMERYAKRWALGGEGGGSVPDKREKGTQQESGCN